jgi:Vacuolar sorting protein 9 (VPS9) domain
MSRESHHRRHSTLSVEGSHTLSSSSSSSLSSISSAIATAQQTTHTAVPGPSLASSIVTRPTVTSETTSATTVSFEPVLAPRQGEVILQCRIWLLEVELRRLREELDASSARKLEAKKLVKKIEKHLETEYNNTMDRMWNVNAEEKRIRKKLESVSVRTAELESNTQVHHATSTTRNTSRQRAIDGAQAEFVIHRQKQRKLLLALQNTLELRASLERKILDLKRVATCIDEALYPTQNQKRTRSNSSTSDGSTDSQDAVTTSATSAASASASAGASASALASDYDTFDGKTEHAKLRRLPSHNARILSRPAADSTSSGDDETDSSLSSPPAQSPVMSSRRFIPPPSSPIPNTTVSPASPTNWNAVIHPSYHYVVTAVLSLTTTRDKEIALRNRVHRYVVSREILTTQLARSMAHNTRNADLKKQSTHDASDTTRKPKLSLDYPMCRRVLQYICLELHRSGLVHDHTHHHRSYAECFNVNEVLLWMARCGLCADRENALSVLNTLRVFGFVHRLRDYSTPSMPFSDHRMVGQLRCPSSKTSFVLTGFLTVVQRFRNARRFFIFHMKRRQLAMFEAPDKLKNPLQVIQLYHTTTVERAGSGKKSSLSLSVSNEREAVTLTADDHDQFTAWVQTFWMAGCTLKFSDLTRLLESQCFAIGHSRMRSTPSARTSTSQNYFAVPSLGPSMPGPARGAGGRPSTPRGTSSTSMVHGKKISESTDGPLSARGARRPRSGSWDENKLDGSNATASSDAVDIHGAAPAHLNAERAALHFNLLHAKTFLQLACVFDDAVNRLVRVHVNTNSTRSLGNETVGDLLNDSIGNAPSPSPRSASPSSPPGSSSFAAAERTSALTVLRQLQKESKSTTPRKARSPSDSIVNEQQNGDVRASRHIRTVSETDRVQPLEADYETIRTVYALCQSYLDAHREVDPAEDSVKEAGVELRHKLVDALSSSSDSSPHSLGVLFNKFNSLFNTMYEDAVVLDVIDTAMEQAFLDTIRFIDRVEQILRQILTVLVYGDADMDDLDDLEQAHMEYLWQHIRKAVSKVVFTATSPNIVRLYDLKFLEDQKALDDARRSNGRIILSKLDINDQLKLPDAASDAVPYLEAIQQLESITKCRDPGDKIDAVVQVGEAICQCIDRSSSNGSNSGLVIGADDLLLLFCYIVSYAEVEDLFAQVEFIGDYNQQFSAHIGGYYVTTLQAAIQVVASGLVNK